MKKRTIFITCLFTALSPFSIASASLILNGDFESTSGSAISIPDGWNVVGINALPKAYENHSVVPAASGEWAVDLGPSGTDSENGGTLFQTFSVNQQGKYVFSFDYSNESHNSSQLADFNWSLSGLINDGNSLFNIGGGYSTFTKEYDIGSLGDITVSFSDIIGNGHAYDAIIDNVSFSLESVSVVPEPMPFTLFGLGLALLGFFKAYKKS